tara:strand:- start:6522 stop:7160 length:639 start_codon:yes stop_codon:yes gene_type:complete
MYNTRVYAQYADKPKAVKWFNIVPDIADELFTVFDSVRGSYDIDNAKGSQLDVIGRIIVIDRSFESQVFFDVDTVFGKDTLAAQFGGVDSQFESTGTNISNTVSDSIFRVLIKAKIAKNNSDATLDGVVKALSYITSSSPIQIIDNEDMTFSVSFGTVLTDIEKFVFDTFDIVPRPQGVKFLGYVEELTVTQFGGDFGWGDTRANFGLYFGV